jgi:Predicted membrane protein
MDNDKKTGFIQCGDARIKLSNIKNYGIKTNTTKSKVAVQKKKDDIERENNELYKKYLFELDAYQKRTKGQKVKSKLKGTGVNILGGTVAGGIAGAVLGEGIGAFVGVPLGFIGGLISGPFMDYDKPKLEKTPETFEKDVVTKKRYLYITTFQRDNFEYYENKVPFNIFNKCKELDEYFKVN